MDDVNYQKIEIDTANPFILSDFTEDIAPTKLKAELFTPATLKPPFPAVVVCEGLGGVKNARERRYGRFFAQNGFVSFVVDSFGTRGYGKAPHPIRAINVTESMMLADAFSALQWLSEQPNVDPNRIYITGYSYGGMITVLTAYEQIRKHFVKGDAKFAGHVSYYGPTVPRMEDYSTTGAPVVILNGELDNNVNFDRLESIAEDLKNGGSAVENIVYANTYHQWDSDDHERRFDRFSIKDTFTRITPENRIINEKSGGEVKGFTSRLKMIATTMSLKGFHLMRDADVMRESDEVVLRTFAIPGTERVEPGALPTELNPDAASHLPAPETDRELRRT